jgi:hypothetical protein
VTVHTLPAVLVPLERALPALLAIPADGGPVWRRAPDSLRAWALAAHLALRLVRAQSLAPALVRSDDRTVTGTWRALLAATPDARTAAAQLAAALPPAAHAVAHDDGHVAAPDALVSAFLDAVADLAVRSGTPPPDARRPRARLLPWTARWAEALADADDPSVPLRDDAEELVAGVSGWLASAGGDAGAAAVPELRLHAPDDPLGEWRVSFGARTPDGTFHAAEDVWQPATADAESAALQHALLAGLARCARVFPPLDGALGEAAPSGLALDLDGAWTFVAEAAPVLAGAGAVVVLPSDLSHQQLRARVRVEAASAEAARFTWELALGDEQLSVEEFERLTAGGAPLVRWRDHWVQVDPRTVEEVRRLGADRGRGGSLPLPRALALGLAGSWSVADLIDGERVPDEAVEVVAGDGLADLLDRLRAASDRPDPADAPPGFAGQLRPYQRRGVAWLGGMGELGFGAVLADEMGLGKCVGPDTPVFANGTIVRAEDLWAHYASAAVSDGEGEWAAPAHRLVTNALIDDHRIGMATVRRLYRQRIREAVRRVTLDDGSSLLLTRRHQLLTADGWTNQIRAGDRVCVPARLEWQGRGVDARLAVFLAWQIAEGHERPHGVLKVAQKDVTVLAHLRDMFVAWAREHDVKTNVPPIACYGEKTPYLQVNNAAYMHHLNALGYEWGARSATKRIPDFLMAADDDGVRAFLQAFFTAAASVGVNQGCVEVSSASPWLMQQVAALLRRFGVWLRVSRHTRVTNGNAASRPCAVGLIGGPSLRRFCDAVGFSDARTQSLLEQVTRRPAGDATGRALARLATPAAAALAGAQKAPVALCLPSEPGALADREVLYARVAAVEEVFYEGWVYDLEVAEHHNFVAAGVLCHNTVQLIAHLLNRPDDRPSLVVCPTSVLGNWQRELGRFAPDLEVTRYHGVERPEDLSKTEGVVLTTYAMLRREVDALADVEWDVVTLDEAQFVKNPATAGARAVRRLRRRQAVALTGTPLENRLAELWSLLDATNPGLLGARARFARRFVTPIEQRRDPNATARLRRLVAPFVLRRTKDDPAVVNDLPAKIERTVVCGLTPEQASLYEAAVARALGEGLDEASQSRRAPRDTMQRRGRILALLTELKQICNHPAQYLHEASPTLLGRSGKLAAAREIVGEAVAADAQILVFTQYVEMGHLLVAQLSADVDAQVPFLHGGVAAAQRDRIVARFQGEEGDRPPVLVLSLRAGGTGLNLTAATHVVHYDRWWNPAVEDQATDRAHRIGQTRTVEVHKLVTAGTVEERVAAILDAKRALAAQVVGAGETWITELGDAELAELVALAPDADVAELDDDDDAIAEVPV